MTGKFHGFAPPRSNHGILGGAQKIDHMKGLTVPGDGHVPVPQRTHPIHMTPPHPDRITPIRRRR